MSPLSALRPGACAVAVKPAAATGLTEPVSAADTLAVNVLYVSIRGQNGGTLWETLAASSRPSVFKCADSHVAVSDWPFALC